MNTVHYNSSGYEKSMPATKSKRSLEYDTIAAITSRLKKAGEQPDNYTAYVEALDSNRRMWGVIATSMLDPQNTYPNSLKSKLYYLFEFTSSYSQNALNEKSSLDVLIDINKAVLRGLKCLDHT